ncbi:hypothetical protein AHAS_Ahas16G0207500 [Arachis hypogaea]
MRVDDRPCEPSECESAAMFPGVGKAVGAASFYALTPTEKFQAHRHVLVNSLTVEKFIEAITKRQLRSRTRSQSHIDNVVHREFPEWFNREVPLGSIRHSSELQWLACGPNVQASRFTAYNVNGFRFRILSREEGLKTQNSGVHVTSDTRSYASKRDSNIAENTTSGRGIKQDVLGHTLVSFSKPIHVGDREDDEPYILASEARLVYYVEDEVDKE